MSPLDRVREICLALPEATEKLAWGEPTFRVRNKLFATYADANNHHGEGRHALWCPAPPGVQQALVASDPKRYFIPPYVGKSGWIGLDLALVSDTELEMHVWQAYLMIAPQKLRALIHTDT